MLDDLSYGFIIDRIAFVFAFFPLSLAFPVLRRVFLCIAEGSGFLKFLAFSPPLFFSFFTSSIFLLEINDILRNVDIFQVYSCPTSSIIDGFVGQQRSVMYRSLSFTHASIASH